MSEEFVLKRGQAMLFSQMSRREQFNTLAPEKRIKIIESMEDEEYAKLHYDWEWNARPKQLWPDHPESTAATCSCEYCQKYAGSEEVQKRLKKLDPKDRELSEIIQLRFKCHKTNWLTWILLAGRGFGKTRIGAEWVRHIVENGQARRIAIVSPTSADARDVAVEGESGIMNISPPWFMPQYEPTKRRLTWPNGAQAAMYSSQEPDRLRGPQHDAAWTDEIAGWETGTQQMTWDMLQFGLRLGKDPKCVVTTTPKPTILIQNLVKMAKEPENRILITTGSTYENKGNLAAPFFRQITQYEGTNLGRQEIYAELIDIEESGIIKRGWFKKWPNDKPIPYFEFIIQSYDTAFTDKHENDPTACTVWGVFRPAPDEPFGLMLLDAWTEYLKYPDLRTKVIQEFHSNYGSKNAKPDIVLMEEKGSGISLIQDLERQGVYVRRYNPGREDKSMRLHGVSHIVYNGRVWIPESKKIPGEFTTWAEDFVRETCGFPNSAHDDYVDTFSQALALFRDQQWTAIGPYVEEEIDTDVDYSEKRRTTNPYAC